MLQRSSGILLLNRKTIHDFINELTHKDKETVQREICKALYNYYWNKHSKANWRRSHYLGEIDEAGCKWQAFSIFMKIQGSFNPFSGKETIGGKMWPSDDEEEDSD